MIIHENTIEEIRIRAANHVSEPIFDPVHSDLLTLLRAVDERNELLEKITFEADTTEDSGDFVIWIQEMLTEKGF